MFYEINIIKEEYPDAEFYPLSYDEMKVRIEKLNELARNSDHKYVIMTGCGEEQAMWEEIKKKMINRYGLYKTRHEMIEPCSWGVIFN